ncbi:hypothetical protein JHD50_11880 [Sulfurimonas sp. MAG313]|nr:hypothetical protein [Sulfurimonas sp. MAG313]MDF1881988.1 hypothetical protein [Sulfurimonas sp. MAG313]
MQILDEELYSKHRAQILPLLQEHGGVKIKEKYFTPSVGIVTAIVLYEKI